MDFQVQTKISNFIENQFPDFYKEEGENFILFVKTYYEWLELEGNPTHESRNLLNYRDVDNTLDKFLDYFQKKYVFGIPPNIIVNKRFLIKHILDIYRSKSSIEGYKLLFRIVYNEDLDVYLPGIDILRASDGTWKEPTYLELSNALGIEKLIGKTIVGSSTRTTAVVENFIRQPLNGTILNILYISHIQPKGGSFNIGEKIYDYDYYGTDVGELLLTSPKIVGSMNRINLLSGGDNFKIGDVLKIAHRDLDDNSFISKGIDGLVRVTKTSRQTGVLRYTIPYGGFGFTTFSKGFVYKNPIGSGASFGVGSVSNAREMTYNTDCIGGFLGTTLNVSAFGLEGNVSANLSSNLNESLTFSNAIFGSVAVLTNVKSGNGYLNIPYCFAKCVYDSIDLSGTINYSSSSNTVTGTATSFDSFFTTNSVIYIQANSSTSTGEYHVVKEVTNSTSIQLYGKPSYTSNGTSIYKVCPEIIKSNYALYDEELNYNEISISSYLTLDANVYAVPSSGNTSVVEALSYDSGKGYIDGEFVKMYLYSGVSTPVIVMGGNDYANNDPLIFSGGDPYQHAQGYVETDSSGIIISLVMKNLGSGYKKVPSISVRSKNGSKAVITTTLQEYNNSYEVTGQVINSGVGKGRGYWSTTRGFLNSDKYIQDSYYYQDYSYELKTALVLNKYKDILYNTFHTSGSELFGKYVLKIDESSKLKVLYESNVSIEIIG